LGENVFGDEVRGPTCGVVLLIFFLIFDSFTGQWQTRMFQLNKNLSPVQMMLITNAFSAMFSFITLIHQEELEKTLSFIYAHPHMILHLLVFCITSTIGQLFIFYTVKSFGAVVFAIIMSIRILCSTILSCLLFSHPVDELAFIGILIVFGAVFYRIVRKTEGKTLIRWKDSDADHSRQVFRSWHEHADV
jgi:adenosine 3'-phospho 5'-phosphosulfate transporter B2